MSEDWSLDLVSVTDGDTVRAHLSRTITMLEGWDLRLHSTHPRGTPLRVVILDTPERGQAGWDDAREDALAWLQSRGRLRCRTYESAGWDRLLADIYAAGDRNDTLTQHMLRSGWGAYVKGTP